MGCKSISHSIRKHLFNGTGVTPKRRRSKSSTRSTALCYTSETSPPDADDIKSPELKPSGRSLQFGSQRNLLESTPVSEFIRHPAYSKQAFLAANANPLASIPSELAKENCHQEQVISPLTQSAQRFPYFARDSIMTPRCRKPVFTFSPIDEPADDLVPNSDAIQLANLNCIQPANAKKTEEICSSSASASSSPQKIEEICSSSASASSSPQKIEEICSSPSSASSSATDGDDSSLADDSDSFLSG